MRSLVLLLVLGAVGYYGYQMYYTPPAGFTVSSEADPGTPFLVKVHADSCRKCIDLGPVWTRLDSRLGDSARLVVLDVTNEERFERTKHIARYLGLTGFLKERREQTGTVAVLDGETREVVATFNGDRNVESYLAAVARARRG